MKKKGWAIGIIVVGVLYLALVSFTLLNSLTSLIFFSPKNEFEPILTQEQAVLLTKQACELHNKAVVYTNEALNADADKKTYQEWEQDVDTALKLWDQLGEVTGLLQYNSGIKKQADQPLREFFTFFSPAKQLWFAGAGEDNFADRLRDIGTLFESDRALSDAYLKAAQQSVSEADWQADNENVGSMQVNLAKLRETLKVQHADRSFSQRDGTIDFEFAGTDTILLIGDDTLYIISNSGSGQAFSANTNIYSNLWTADETHEGQYIMAPKDALFLRTYDVDKPVFLEAKADEIFKDTYSAGGVYEIDVTQEMDAKNGPAKYKDKDDGSSGDENAAALEAEAISAPEPTPDTGEAQEESPESDISDQDEDDADADETPAATEQSPVVFIDSAFESMMRIALNKNSEAIYQSDLDQIEKLTIAGSAFAWVGDAYSLDYFGQDNYCINGEKYDDMGTIARVDDLSKFTNLKELTIIYNDIRNIDGIGDAPALEKADLSVNAITDISPIYRSGTLEYINFGLNDIMNEQESAQVVVAQDAFRVNDAARYLGAVACGYGHTLGITNTGSVLSVGEKSNNNKREVDDWRDIVMVAAGNDHSVGLKSDGTVVAIGSNKSFGQCNVSSWVDIVMIAAGGTHTVGLKKDGTVVAVGLNSEGQCDVSEWRDIVMIAAGSYHTVGLKSDGTVVAVGHNGNSRSNLTDWTDIVAIACGSKHTVGLKSDGTVVAKGWADKYQLNVDRWEDIVAISAGEQYTIGLTAKGQVKVAGDISSRLSKETKTKAIFGGPLNVIILKEDENFYGYGDNTYGQNNVGAWSESVLVE